VTDLATRYGTRSPARHRALLVGVSALAVIFLGWLAWVILEHGDPEVTSDMVSFEVVDQHTATATFRVVRSDAEVSASCLLRAQSRDHATVGEKTVPVGPGGPEAQIVTETVRTERLATTVDVVGCVTAEQARPR